MKKLFLILSACMTVLMVSCVKEPPKIDVQSVTVTPDAKTLEIGGTVTLTAAVLPDDATDKTVVWASSDAQVASVTENGVVKALKAGTANITATSGSASGKAVITVVPVIGTAEASYTVGNEGGKVNIAVVAQSVNIDADAQKWLSAKVEADKIVMTVSPNEEYDDRSAEITIVTVFGEQKTTITQGMNLGIIAAATAEVSCEGGVVEIPVNANVPYSAEITAGEEWLSALGTKGLTETVYTVTAARNIAMEAREGEITFTSEDGTLTQKVAVKQATPIWMDATIDVPANPRNTYPVFNKEITRAYFVTRGARYLYEINLETGTIGWKFDMSDTDKNDNGGCICVNPFTGDIIVSKKTAIICVNSDGTQKWSKDVAGQNAFSINGCGPAINNDGTVVFAPCHDRTFYALSAADGSTLATFDMAYNGTNVQFGVYGDNNILLVRQGLDPVFLHFTGNAFETLGTVDFKVGLADLTCIAIDKAQKYAYIQRNGGYASLFDIETMTHAGIYQHGQSHSWAPGITPDGHVYFAVQDGVSIKVIDRASNYNTADAWVSISTGLANNSLNFMCPACDTENNLYYYGNTPFSFYKVPVTGGTPEVIATLDKSIPEYQAVFNFGGNYIVIGGGKTSENRIVVLKLDARRAPGWSGNGGDPCGTKNANLVWAE